MSRLVQLTESSELIECSYITRVDLTTFMGEYSN